MWQCNNRSKLKAGDSIQYKSMLSLLFLCHCPFLLPSGPKQWTFGLIEITLSIWNSTDNIHNCAIGVIHNISCSFSRDSFLQAFGQQVSVVSYLRPRMCIPHMLLMQELTNKFCARGAKRESTSTHLQSENLFCHSVPRSSRQQSVRALSTVTAVADERAVISCARSLNGLSAGWPVFLLCRFFSYCCSATS